MVVMSGWGGRQRVGQGQYETVSILELNGDWIWRMRKGDTFHWQGIEEQNNLLQTDAPREMDAGVHKEARLPGPPTGRAGEELI